MRQKNYGQGAAEILTIAGLVVNLAVPMVQGGLDVVKAVIEKDKPPSHTYINAVAQPVSPIRIEMVEPMEAAPVPLQPLVEE